jgi:hypothetical protein
MYPFTQTAASYVARWPEECRRKGSSLSIIDIAKEAANDEKGHDRLILKDLETLKIPISVALNKFRSGYIQVCISHFKQSVAANPLHFLAWLYCIEKQTVESVTAELLQSYQKILGPFHKAMRFWRIHSAAGLEAEHVKKREQWIATLPAGQQQSLIHEMDKITPLLSNQQNDLDCAEFDQFMTQHAPHLIDIAWGANLLRFHFGTNH